MTAKKKAYDDVDASLEISSDELFELEKPFVFIIAGKRGALKGNGSFSLDDYDKVGSLAEENPKEVIDLIAYDEDSAALLRNGGHKVLQKILLSWFKTEGLMPGESESSES